MIYNNEFSKYFINKYSYINKNNCINADLIKPIEKAHLSLRKLEE